MVGDGENDVKAGQAVGCRTSLINDRRTSEIVRQFGQNITLEHLLEFTVKEILSVFVIKFGILYPKGTP